MKTNPNILFLLSALLLSACGGGGDGDNQVDNSMSGNSSQEGYINSGITAKEKQNFQIISDALQTASPSNWVGMHYLGIMDTNNPGIVIGGEYAINSSYHRGVVSEEATGEMVVLPIGLPDSHVNSINIYGNPMGSKGYIGGSQSYKYFMVSDVSYNAVQFGVSETDDNNPTLGLFFRALPTKESNMPKAGQVSYLGDFIGSPNINGDNFTGTVTAEVDFGVKRVDLSVSGTGGYKGSVTAEIIGSTFAGRSGSKETIGMFGGSEASELTGAYTDTQANVYGVYGAKIFK